MNTKSLVKTVLAAVTAFSLAACSSGSTSASGSTASASAAGSASMVAAVNWQYTTMDPALNTEVVNSLVLQHIYAGMFRKDADGVAQPELCESYEVSEDGKTYTFHMVQDAVWSDGTPVTANDFVYSYLRVMSYGADNAYAANDMLNFIEGARAYNENAITAGEDFDCTAEDHSSVGVEAADDYTLVLKLTNPCTYLPGLMCSGVWTAVPQSTPQHDSSWSMSAGNVYDGPYVMTEFNENEKAVVEKNDSYIAADTITMDEITFQVMTDADAQDVAYKSGEIDIADGVSSETAQSYLDTDHLWLISTPSSYFLAINSGSTGPEWAKDVNVRKALAEAIDKDALVEVLGGSDFYPVLNGYVPYGLSGKDGDYREEGDQTATYPTYNPDDAKALLAAAGYDESNPLKITYKYSNNSIHGDVATVLGDMWSAIGVEVEFEAVESGVYFDQLDQGDFEISRYGYNASDSPIQFLDCWTTSIQVVAAVDDAKYDEMVANIKTIADPDEFTDACHEAEEYLWNENVYVIPLFQSTKQYLVADGLSGYEIHGVTPFYGYCSWN